GRGVDSSTWSDYQQHHRFPASHDRLRTSPGFRSGLNKAFCCHSINSPSPNSKNEGKHQHLRLVFATHEISIRGHALRRIETAMQRTELSFLAALSGNQRSLISDGQPVVLEIAVREINDTQNRTV